MCSLLSSSFALRFITWSVAKIGHYWVGLAKFIGVFKCCSLWNMTKQSRSRNSGLQLSYNVWKRTISKEKVDLKSVRTNNELRDHKTSVTKGCGFIVSIATTVGNNLSLIWCPLQHRRSSRRVWHLYSSDLFVVEDRCLALVLNCYAAVLAMPLVGERTSRQSSSWLGLPNFIAAIVV